MFVTASGPLNVLNAPLGFSHFQGNPDPCDLQPSFTARIQDCTVTLAITNDGSNR
mgnify:CR=1 FL=1